MNYRGCGCFQWQEWGDVHLPQTSIHRSLSSTRPSSLSIFGLAGVWGRSQALPRWWMRRSSSLWIWGEGNVHLYLPSMLLTGPAECLQWRSSKQESIYYSAFLNWGEDVEKCTLTTVWSDLHNLYISGIFTHRFLFPVYIFKDPGEDPYFLSGKLSFCMYCEQSGVLDVHLLYASDYYCGFPLLRRA